MLVTLVASAIFALVSNEPITAQLSNEELQRSGIAWSHMRLRQIQVRIYNSTIIEDENEECCINKCVQSNNNNIYVYTCVLK